jgi:hypothetical protein
MKVPSIEDFRGTLRLTWESRDSPGVLIFSYWNNGAVTSSSCDTEEILHINRGRDGSFHLQIANLVHKGTLEELERILYDWALDEGWLEEWYAPVIRQEATGGSGPPSVTPGSVQGENRI